MSATTLLAVVLSALALPAGACCVYLLLLTLLSRRQRPAPAAARALRFDVVVPAHDEEANIAATVRSLLAVSYPRELFRVLVVADNCTDATAARAADAGATVLERKDEDRRGKGYALAHAFAHSLQGDADAVVVVDADTIVSPDLLAVFAALLSSGARAAQAHYGVSNPAASWRTRLMAVALGMFHQVRSLGRERLRVSCGLRGNGMCFSRQALREVPHEAFSIVEDVEYGIRLAEAGHRVVYAGEAFVLGEMVSGEKAARSQRRRWEQGRMQLLRQHGARLLRLSLQRRDRVLFDVALDVLVPPLSIIAAAVVLGLLGAAALAYLTGHAGPLLIVYLFFTICLLSYGFRGWQLSGTGASGLLALLAAPLYVAWKVLLLARRPGRKASEWVRTTREGRGS